MYSETTATKKIVALKKRIRGIAGGTSASKTISILLYLIALCQYDTTPKLTSIVSESFPHLKRGAIRDFLNIMQAHGYYKDERWNRSDYIYTFETGSKIEFFSADQPGKVRGPRRDRLFVNEANNVPYESWDQLVIRTNDFAIADWNPTNEFWFYTEVLNKRDDVEFITLTYKDNEALSPNIVNEIESHKSNKNWWLVYGLGQLGELENRIYRGWTIIDDVPGNARLERRGLDFGYSNDPAAIIDIYRWNYGFVLDERLYRKGLSNRDLYYAITGFDLPETPVFADSAEPKSIDELASYGLSIIPGYKGKGSVNAGIQWIQGQQIFVTKRSINLLKEYRNYLWKTDKDGKQLTVPEDFDNHLMDALRYGLESYIFTRKGDTGMVTAKVPHNEVKSWVADEQGGVPAQHTIDIARAIQESTRGTERDWRYN